MMELQMSGLMMFLKLVRTHLRLWTIYTGDVIGGVHHETLFGVNDFEDSERRVLDEFDDSIVPEVTNDIEYHWDVSVDSYWLNNVVTDPAFNNGRASEVR